MAGADNIWGSKEQPKAPTATETLRPWGLENTTAPVTDDEGAADYQRPGSGALVDTANKADSDPLAWLKNKWQQERQQPGGGVVTGDGELPGWMNNGGHITTLPTFGDTQQYYNGTDKEGGASAENNPVKSYLGKSFNQAWRGNYTDDVTLLGTAAQMAAGFFDLDLPMDIRDLSYDITHWESTPEHIRQTILDAIGFIPGIGMVKYADELGTLAKNADKAADVAKEADEAAKGGEKIGNAFKVNVGQQEKHITGTNNYNQSVNSGKNRSILNDDAQSLLDQFAGKGQKLGANKERVNFGKVIGQYYDAKTGKYVDTTNGIIHYDANGGAHIVPARP